MTVAVVSVVVLLALGVGIAVLRSRAQASPAALPEPPAEDEDTEEVDDELTEADSLIAGKEPDDWTALLLDAAEAAWREGSVDGFEAVRTRFLARRSGSDDELARELRDPATFLRREAMDCQHQQPRRALALVQLAATIAPDDAAVQASRASIALTCLDATTARDAAARAVAGGQCDGDGLQARAAQLFRDADAPLVLPLRAGSADLVRSAEQVRVALGLYHGRLAARRRRLVAAGVVPSRPWLPPPPGSWASEPGPEPISASHVDELEAAQAEWAGARALCAAVGWVNLQPTATVVAAPELGSQLAGVREALRVARSCAAPGAEPASAAVGALLWRGVDLAAAPPAVIQACLREIAEVHAALSWLVRDDVASPFDDGLRDP